MDSDGSSAGAFAPPMPYFIHAQHVLFVTGINMLFILFGSNSVAAEKKKKRAFGLFALNYLLLLLVEFHIWLIELDTYV